MSVIVITSPPDDEEGGRVAGSRVRVNIEYDPPEFASDKQIAKTRKALQREADKIVAKYG